MHGGNLELKHGSRFLYRKRHCLPVGTVQRYLFDLENITCAHQIQRPIQRTQAPGAKVPYRASLTEDTPRTQFARPPRTKRAQGFDHRENTRLYAHTTP